MLRRVGWCAEAEVRGQESGPVIVGCFIDRMKGVFVMQLLLHLVLCVGEPEAERRS